MSTKRNHWREFVRESGNDDPWGAVYKMCRGKNSKREIGTLQIGTTRTGETIYTEGWEQSVEVLLDKFFPSVEERVVKGALERTCMEFTTGEVEAAIWSLNPRKSPGLDGLTGRRVRSLWKAISEWLYRL